MSASTDASDSRFAVAVVGTSLGGLNSLQRLLHGLPEGFVLPIVVVQHRAKDSDDRLISLLQPHTTLVVREAEDKEKMLPGRVYLAPPDYHLLLEPGRFALSTEAPVWNARPSVDVLFESAADAYAARVIGVVLTGMGEDGARGAARIKQRGGLVVVQDPRAAEADAMPRAAAAAAGADWVMPLEDIGPFLAETCAAETRLVVAEPVVASRERHCLPFPETDGGCP